VLSDSRHFGVDLIFSAVSARWRWPTDVELLLQMMPEGGEPVAMAEGPALQRT